METWNVALQKRFTHHGARFDLDVRFATAARRLVLHGPSGAGKTQTLRMIAGITRPDAGHVVVAGERLGDCAAGLWLSPQQRRIGYVFQDDALFPHLSVRQNIAFALAPGWRNPRRAARDERVERWIERFGLQPVADHLPHQVSGGQRQRTALARALVGEPAALLLDEPFSALDRNLRVRLREELAALQHAIGVPMLLITYDDEDLRHLADAVVAIDAGRADGAAAPA